MRNEQQLRLELQTADESKYSSSYEIQSLEMQVQDLYEAVNHKQIWMSRTD